MAFLRLIGVCTGLKHATVRFLLAWGSTYSLINSLSLGGDRLEVGGHVQVEEGSTCGASASWPSNEVWNLVARMKWLSTFPSLKAHSFCESLFTVVYCTRFQRRDSTQRRSSSVIWQQVSLIYIYICVCVCIVCDMFLFKYVSMRIWMRKHVCIYVFLKIFCPWEK